MADVGKGRGGARVRRPRADEEEPWPATDYQHSVGDAKSNIECPTTDADDDRYRRELRRALKRKRPIGFQADWGEYE